MFKFIMLLSFLSISVFGEVKISQLPLQTGGNVGSTDSFPFVNVSADETMRLNISAIANVPSFQTALAASFLPLTGGTITGNLSVAAASGSALTISKSNNQPEIYISSSAGNGFRIQDNGPGTFAIANDAGSTSLLSITEAGVVYINNLTASQAVVTDGSKNLVSLGYGSSNTASTLVERDSSGNFSAGTITGALTGTASGNTTYTANQYGVVLSGSANAMSVLAPSSSTVALLQSGGASANPAWAVMSGDATIASGGALTIGANKVTAAKSSSGAATSGQFARADGSGNVVYESRSYAVGTAATANGSISGTTPWNSFSSSGSPTVSITPARTKAFHVFCPNFVGYTSGTNQLFLTIQVTTGSVSSTVWPGGAILVTNGTNTLIPAYIDAVFVLTAGTAYTFTLQGYVSSGSANIRGDDAPNGIVLIAEEIN